MGAIGALVVVGTPIGNLGDLSPRASAELAAVDAIACEDSRRTGRLLSLAGIPAPRLVVTNEHTEYDRVEEILSRLAQGQRVALVSDAGMPTISDPGRQLVAAVAAAGYQVEVVPGPVAAMTALSASGFPADRFVFEGFLPRKGSARAERLAVLAAEERTIVLYEAPHRLARTLLDLEAACGAERPAVVARELTKLHEELIRGSLGELAARMADGRVKGEVVVVIEGATVETTPVSDEELRRALATAVDGGSSRRDAVAAVVAATGAPKRHVYELATSLDEPVGEEG